MSRLPPRPFLYPLTDASLGSEAPGRLAERLFVAGARIVQLRDKALSDGAFLAQALAAVAAARRAGALLVVNDRLDVALLAGADGVHLGDDDLPVEQARRVGGERLLIGRSTHSVEEALRVADSPVDYVALGPIYDSASKPGRRALGPEALRRVRAGTDKPLVAIGGVEPARFAEVVAAGADGVAAIGALVPLEYQTLEERTGEVMQSLRQPVVRPEGR